MQVSAKSLNFVDANNTRPKVTYSENHCCNERTMKDYVHKVILPYIANKKKELKLSLDHPALLIFDNLKHSAPLIYSKPLTKTALMLYLYLQTALIGYSR